mgnify:CR=1 FL=1
MIKNLLSNNYSWLAFISGSAIIKVVNVAVSLIVASIVDRSEYGIYGLLLTYFSFSMAFISAGRVSDSLVKKTSTNDVYVLKTIFIVLWGSLLWVLLFWILADILCLEIYNKFGVITLYLWLVAFILNNITPSLFVSLDKGQILTKVGPVYVIIAALLFVCLELNLKFFFYTQISLALVYLLFLLQHVSVLSLVSLSPRRVLRKKSLSSDSAKFWIGDVLWATINLVIVVLIGSRSMSVLGDYSLYNQLLFILLFIPTTIAPLAVRDFASYSILSIVRVFTNKYTLLSSVGFLGLSLIAFFVLTNPLKVLSGLAIEESILVSFIFAGFGQVMHGIVISVFTASKSFRILPLLKLLPKLTVLLVVACGLSNLSYIMLIKGIASLLSVLFIVLIRKN